jgi:LPS-assembly protein
MKRFNLITINLIFLISINLHGSLKINDILVPTTRNIESCFSYSPLIGAVKENEDLKINSDKFQIADDNKLLLSGNVELDFPEGLLKTNDAELDRENGTAEFSKSGEIFLQDFYFTANHGRFNRNENTISLKTGKAYSQERSMVFSFDKLDGQIDKIVSLKDVTMTSCVNPDKGWLLEADEIILDAKIKRGRAKDVKIKAAGTTIFAFPLIPFATSNERMSGFLEPAISYSSDGLDLMIPYYKVISKKSDITVAPRLIAKRGAGIEINYRALHGDKKNYRNFDLLYFNKDDEFKKEFLKSNPSRWIYELNDTFSFFSSQIYVDWSKSSDDLILRDIPGEITTIGYQRIQNLNQNISIVTKFKNLEMKVEHQAYQALNPILTNGYIKSPALNLKYTKNINGFIVSEDLNISTFKANKIHGYVGYQLMSNNFLRLIENPDEGQRIFSDLNISKIFEVNGFNIASQVGIKSIDYSLSKSSRKTKNVNVPNALVSISSLFANKANSVTNTLQPKLVVGYTGYKDQKNNPIFDTNEISPNNELYINDRFSGMDRIGDQSFYTLSLDYAKIKMGMKKLSFNISKKYYLKDRKIWMSPSMNPQKAMHSMMDMGMDEVPTVIMASWMPSMKTMVMGYGGYNKKQKKMPLGGITIKHKLKSGDIGYAQRYRRMAGDFNVEMDYSEFFADININTNLKFIAKLNRDNKNKNNIETQFGIQYENCCLALRITSSDRNFSKFTMDNEEIKYQYLRDAWDNMIDIESKSRISFEFELKGLNSSFDKVDRLFNNSLFNY